jgi:hypothetical protein
MFVPSEFTPTQWSTTAEKADFGNTLLRFIEAGWRPTMFTKKLYNRLSNTFGHIAHYAEDAIMRSPLYKHRVSTTLHCSIALHNSMLRVRRSQHGRCLGGCG